MLNFIFKFALIWISFCHFCEHYWGQTSFDLDFLKENSTEPQEIKGLESDTVCAMKPLNFKYVCGFVNPLWK